MHRDRRSGQLAELECAAAMVDVGVSVDYQIELPSSIGEDAEVALDLLAERIDHNRLTGVLRQTEVGFALGMIEFLEEHVGPRRELYRRCRRKVNGRRR